MSEQLLRIEKLINYTKTLIGDEKGEAQVFCDRLFQAFGHEGYKEAGATLEFRVKTAEKKTKFADLIWKPRLLLEMKKRGEKLEKHYQQAFEYWLELVPIRPRYVVLCNFDEFWVYDFDLQLRTPVDKVRIEELADRYVALNFLFHENKRPLFQNNQVDVTRTAADNVAQVFNSLISRGENPETAQRFVLQCVVALFSEDIDLLPKGLFTELIEDCRLGKSSYDLIGGLFRQMGIKKPAPKDSYLRDVPYFNGGIFSTVDPLSLNGNELDLLSMAAAEKWSKVEPAIFGSLFESSMGKTERHALGAHYTSEVDIQKVVLPTIIRPFQERVDSAKTLAELLAIRKDLISFKVLDPACGSGNFLYVTYRELKRIEAEIIARIQSEFKNKTAKDIGSISLVKTSQFFGIDIKPFAVELAKVTLMLAKKLAIDEEKKLLDLEQGILYDTIEKALPLDNLDNNIICDDALFCDWAQADAIIGNPPFQSKNKIQSEYGPLYVAKVREEYPEVPGRADFCVYWFRKAHQHLKENGRAGLVGTNTIRQNYSREGGLR